MSQIQQVEIVGGGGADVQYAEGTTHVTATGTVALAKDASNVVHAVTVDGSGNLNVNLAAGSISGGNAAAGTTGAAVPANADYGGVNVAGNLRGVTGYDLDTGAGVEYQGGVSVRISASGGSIEAKGQQVMASSLPVVIASDQSAVPISAASLPLPTNAATSAKQPALGTAGTASADVITIQGKSGMTAVVVDGSGVTQPVSGSVTVAGTVTANIGSSGSLALDASVTGLQVAQASTTSGEKGSLVQGAVTTAAPTYTTAQTNPLSLTTAGALRTDASGTTQPVSGTVAATQSGTWTVQPGNTANTTAWKVDGSAVTQPVSIGATVTVAGSVTANIGSSGSLALDASVTGLQVSQGSTTAAQKGGLVQGAVTTGAPSYTTAQTSPLSLTTAGAVRVDASATTQPVSGTVAATQSGTWTVQPGNTANTTAWKVDGSAVTQPVSGSVTANIGSSGSLALDASVTGLQVAQASTTAAQKGLLMQGAVTTGSPSYTTTQTDPLSLTTAGALRVDGSAVTQPISVGTVTVTGTVTDNQGTANTAANAWPIKVSDGVSVQAVKAASTAAVAADPASVVTLSPNQPQFTTPLNAGIADGLDVAEGATTDALVLGDTLGSVSAKLRGLNFHLDQLRRDVKQSNELLFNLLQSTQIPPPVTVSGTGVGVFPVTANALAQSLKENSLGSLSSDLLGSLRTCNQPFVALGQYTVNGRTGTYAGLNAGDPLIAFRWGSNAALAIILRVSINVVTTQVFSATGVIERELIIARSWTASDTGGTAVTLTGNNQKRRTSQGTSLVTDFRFGPTTAGTRTLDAAPLASVVSFIPIGATGVDIGNASVLSTSTLGTTSVLIGGTGMVDLLNATNGQEYPIVLAQNEGFVIRIGKDAMPAGGQQQTYAQITWAEVTSF